MHVMGDEGTSPCPQNVGHRQLLTPSLARAPGGGRGEGQGGQRVLGPVSFNSLPLLPLPLPSSGVLCLPPD